MHTNKFKIISWLKPTTLSLIVILFLFLLGKIANLIGLNNLHVNNLEDYFTSTYINYLIAIAIALFVIYRWKLIKYNNRRNYITLLIYIAPVFIFIVFIGFLNIQNKINLVDSSKIIKFLVFCILVGFTEELLFRGIILGMWRKYISIYYSIIVSSVFFGIVHFANLTSTNYTFEEVESVIFQVILAFGLGIILGSWLIFSKSIIFVSIVHALINFLFGFSALYKTATSISNENENQILSYLFMAIAISILFFYAFQCLRKVKELTNASLTINQL